jgi:hypothetical protein
VSWDWTIVTRACQRARMLAQAPLSALAFRPRGIWATYIAQKKRLRSFAEVYRHLEANLKTVKAIAYQ